MSCWQQSLGAVSHIGIGSNIRTRNRFDVRDAQEGVEPRTRLKHTKNKTNCAQFGLEGAGCRQYVDLQRLVTHDRMYNILNLCSSILLS